MYGKFRCKTTFQHTADGSDDVNITTNEGTWPEIFRVFIQMLRDSDYTICKEGFDMVLNDEFKGESGAA